MGRGKKIVDTSVVIEAAVAFIDERGFEEFSTRRLAGLLRISAMTLYNYFRNRDAILREAVGRSFDLFWEGLRGKVEECYRSCGNPLEVYRILAEHLLQFALSRPNLYRFLFWAGLSGIQQDQRIRSLYRVAFEGVETRIADPSRVEDIHRDLYLFEVVVNALAMNVLTGGAGMTPDRYRDLVAESYERLVARHEASMIG